MNYVDVLAKITGVMEDVFDTDEPINETTTANDIEEWDSLSHIRFIISLEKTFKIKFANSEIALLKNVGELARTVAAKLGV